MINEIIIYSILVFFCLITFAKISYKLDLVDLPSKRKVQESKDEYNKRLLILNNS